jgi:putative DNA methylase
MATTLTSDRTNEGRLRTYDRATSVVFLKTKEAFGGLSNMAGGFPLRVNGFRILTSEALYQACRFPHLPYVQKLIIAEASPMTAKMKGKPHRSNSRPDWDAVRVKIMRWCLRVKLIQNFAEFSRLLLATRDRPIVEESRRDDFWGANPVEPNVLVGQNALGRLLMQLREEVRNGDWQPASEVPPLDLPEFLLLGRLIEPIRGDGATARPLRPAPAAAPQQPATKPDLFEGPKDRMSPNSPPAGHRKKLIEVSIPLEAINVASAREKSIRHGHPSTLHLWWARRPLAACRAVLFSQLVDDPSAWPDRFPTPEAVEAERMRLHKLIGGTKEADYKDGLVAWESSNNEAVLNAARWEIARSVAWGRGEEPPPPEDGAAILAYLQAKAPPVYDPFSGGGSIPLEAQRLGLRASGSDLNPVAVLIGKALVEIPPKFAGLPPVNPASRKERARGGRWQGRGAQGLAEDVRYYGAWMREEAARRIGHLYPEAALPDGSKATVIAWLWARTVRSPDPAAKGAMVPLVSSFMLSTKEGKKAWVEPVMNAAAPDGWRFEVQTGVVAKADADRLNNGTKTGRSGFACILTGASITFDYIRAEATKIGLGRRLMAIVAEGGRARGRQYLSPTQEQITIASTAEANWGPEELVTTPSHDVDRLPMYGMPRWRDAFTPRQLVMLTTYSDLVAEARTRVLVDTQSTSFSDDSTPLAQFGTGATAYADAVATYLGLGVSKLADAQSSLARWKPSMDQTIATFGRQAIPMVWDYAESNAFSDMAGDLAVTLRTIGRTLGDLPATAPASIGNIDAARNSFPVRPNVISTDPPYYDNIGYADLSDFFYVWLRRSLSGMWPELFRRLTTPKDRELVATPYRHGGKEAAEAFFMQGMGEALVAMHNAAVEDVPLVIYYAFKQSEAAEEGVTSAGWASFLQAVVDAGLGVDGTWPVRTELANRMISSGTNALASSIVLVCRKRHANADIATRAEFVRALKREMPDAIAAIRRGGVGPVDMQQSVIGPGMGVFTRFAKVLEDDDSAMPVKTALSLINRIWDEIENELTEAFDAPTQVALAWFATYGFDARPSGELIVLANAKNIPLATLFSSGVFQDLRGKAGLVARADLPESWSPATDKETTIWECVQHTIRVLNAEDGGAEAAAGLVAQMGQRAEDARALAYRLFEIATQKGWASEALIYNALAQEWPRLAEMAPEVIARKEMGAPQLTLL